MFSLFCSLFSDKFSFVFDLPNSFSFKVLFMSLIRGDEGGTGE